MALDQSYLEERQQSLAGQLVVVELQLSQAPTLTEARQQRPQTEAAQPETGHVEAAQVGVW